MFTEVLDEKEANEFIIRNLKISKKRIWFCSPWITRKDIGRYLDKAEDVRIILGFSKKQDMKISDLEFLEKMDKKNNIQVRVNDKAHRKIYIFDSFALIGSSNLTHMGLGQSTNSNLESSVASDDPKILNGAIRHFQDTWNNSIPLSELDIAFRKKRPKIRGIKEILELFRPHNPLERILD